MPFADDRENVSLAELLRQAERVRRILPHVLDARVTAAFNEYLAELESAIDRRLDMFRSELERRDNAGSWSDSKRSQLEEAIKDPVRHNW
jgi:hypothetical protein